ncbi:MAG: Chaperone protein HtpG [Haliscomenobacter sp.]|nr:Chaperone protein HtpG [Haliscomenobacter sp.]
MQKGNISVQTENIFPIIKKFLYSDHEIFLRELVSNAVDATTKLKTLAMRGEVQGELGEPVIEVIPNKEAKTLTIRDQGIGMTGEEVKKYLNQVAFSSAREFLETYKEEAALIGNFGLGFYSAFMVAQKVEVHTKSYQAGANGVTWVCEGSPEYTLEDNDKQDRGTEVVLHLSEDSLEFLEDQRIEDLLKKYCKFLPVPIQFGTKPDFEGKEEEAEEDKDAPAREIPNIINNTHPAWKKNPVDLTDEDYRKFYRELYPFSFEEPLFWIHLNIDYPFTLNGILYFPHLGNALELQRNKIQLYSNQVFVTDNVEDIVPEFLRLLHGVIDSPDIPLNVSRSYLQADGNVKKITSHITKKVADKLEELFKKDRDTFQGKWNDLGVFVKYGMLSDEKFNDRAQKFTLLEDVDGKFYTLEEYQEAVKPVQTNKHGKVVALYTSSPDQHHQQITACKDRGYQVLKLDHVIDSHFMQHVEYKMNQLTFVRVDAETIDHLIEKDEQRESVLSESDLKKMEELFKSVIKDPQAIVQTKAMSPDEQPVLITRPEFMRRLKEMQTFQSMGGASFPDSYHVVINSNHPLIVGKLLESSSGEEGEEMAAYLYRLALLQQGMLKGADLTAFAAKSVSLL